MCALIKRHCVLSPFSMTVDIPHDTRYTFTQLPMTIEDAACVSFRALRFAQGKRSEESARVA